MHGSFAAYGYFNGRSQISLRVLSCDKSDEINERFIEERLKKALNNRLLQFDFNKTAILRLLHSEADFVPGLIVDKYGDAVVIQALSAGAEKFVECAAGFYTKALGVKSVLIKNDASIRKIEGLDIYLRWIGTPLTGPQKILSDEIYYIINIEQGQKTGFFADQRRAYRELSGRVKDASVLDCFSYSGAFSMNAFKYGARRSTLVDISEDALELAKQSARLNGVYDKCEFICGNAFDYLKKESAGVKNHEIAQLPFDFIILDPPTFTKSKANVNEALRGYKEIALRAARLIRDGGFIMSCSCSFHIGLDDFLNSQRDAFSDSHVRAQLIGAGFQDERDHPMLMQMPETMYLKYFLFRASKI